MALTAEGERLLPLAEAALRAVETVDAAAGLPVGGTQALRIGSGDALGREILPRALSALLEETPNLSVRFVEGPGPRLLQALRTGEIDVALVVAPESGARTEGLAWEPLLESAVDVFYPPGTGPRRKNVTIDALAGERLVTLQSGSGFRRRMERLFEEAGARFEPAVEVGNLSLARRFVSAGTGVAAVPAIAFSEGAPGPRVDRRRLTGAAPIAYVRVSRAEAPIPEPARRFLQKL
jgi:DNA-binding transcriptional LysR family regulator